MAANEGQERVRMKLQADLSERITSAGGGLSGTGAYVTMRRKERRQKAGERNTQACVHACVVRVARIACVRRRDV